MTPNELRAWQIQHYTQRLAQARTTEERAFLRNELHNLKKATRHDSAAPFRYLPGSINGLLHLE